MSAQLTKPGEDAAPVDWALYFASHGMRILPVRPRGAPAKALQVPKRTRSGNDALRSLYDAKLFSG